MYENRQLTKKHCKILARKIRIKLEFQYQGGHLIGFSVDEPEKPAKTVLALIVASIMGQPAFFARLIQCSH